MENDPNNNGIVRVALTIVILAMSTLLVTMMITVHWQQQTAGRETGRCMSVAAMQALHRLRECRLLCDAIVRADDGASFPVHRAILSACSPYFLALFTTTLHSREQSDVLISGVRSEILLLLIEYAYLRRIDVTDTNVHELLMTADYLAFLGVLQLCCDHLRSSLNPKNCLGIMTFARRVFCYKLEADARRYLLRYFVTVATQSDEFLHLPLDELNSIILEDELNVKSEEAVWESVLRWVNYDPDGRWQHTVKLMGSIRLGLLDTQFFLENVKDHPYVAGNEGSRPVIIETLKFLYDLEMIAQRDGEVATPEIARPRVPHEVLFAIGGWSGGSPTAFIETYDTRADRWIKVEEVDPAGPRAYHGTAVLGSCIYVIGGFDGMDYFNSCRCFDAVTKIWREVAPMNARRCYVSVAVVGETIYAMGGYDGHHRQNTAEKFNHRTNQWSLVAPMNAQRSDASAASLDRMHEQRRNVRSRSEPMDEFDPDEVAPLRRVLHRLPQQGLRHWRLQRYLEDVQRRGVRPDDQHVGARAGHVQSPQQLCHRGH
ncbi:kelch-like protein 10 isoform X7 [Bombyx mori]|uniref:BTB domain-containing protein n=1 Tax=Bombyx mori TaxID=7091 RepID=A0A8R2DKH3_BOMMO|nr:kelch-like protein 10 isoform X7 [Bombyx mori]